MDYLMVNLQNNRWTLTGYRQLLELILGATQVTQIKKKILREKNKLFQIGRPWLSNKLGRLVQVLSDGKYHKEPCQWQNW